MHTHVHSLSLNSCSAKQTKKKKLFHHFPLIFFHWFSLLACLCTLNPGILCFADPHINSIHSLLYWGEGRLFKDRYLKILTKNKTINIMDNNPSNAVFTLNKQSFPVLFVEITERGVLTLAVLNFMLLF